MLLLQEGKVNVRNVEEDKVLYTMRWSELIFMQKPTNTHLRTSSAIHF